MANLPREIIFDWSLRDLNDYMEFYNEKQKPKKKKDKPVPVYTEDNLTNLFGG